MWLGEGGPTAAPPGLDAERDLLLFSDVHLGADLKREELRRAGSFAALCRRDAVDHAAAGLLEHYAKMAGERPWRLVLAGDVIDFIGMNLTPADLGETAPFELTDDERELGLDPRPDRCAWLMRLVLRRHARFFASLAGFIARGHDVVIVRGNHDAALFWPSVQRAFREGIAEALVREGCDADDATLERALRFEDWFYLEPGRIYVEHGHFHDEICADPGVRQVRPDAPDRLTQSVSAVMLRYFGNRFPSLDLDNVDHWTAWDFVRWAFLRENPLRIFLAMVRTVFVLLVPFARHALRRARQARIRERAPAVVRDPFDFDFEPAAETDLAREVSARIRRADAEPFAFALARAVRRSASVTVGGILRLFQLDRAAAVGGSLAVSAGLGVSDAPVSVKAAVIAVVVLSSVLIDRRLVAARRVAIGPKLRAAAEELARYAPAPLVVMGHSHKAVDTVLADGRTRYVNLGSWLAAGRESAADPGLPHLVVRGACAEFRRWRAPAVHVEEPSREAA